MGQQKGAASRRFLAGRVGWVTVRAGQVGREIVAALASSGAAVGIGLLSTREGREAGEPHPVEIAALDGMLDTVTVAGGQAVGGVFDMSSGEALQRFRDQIERALGPISILVHVLRPKAAAQRDNARLDRELEDWLKMIEAVRPAMMERGWGRMISVIDTTDLPGVDPQWLELARTRLESLTRGIALSLADSGVACFLVGRDAPQSPAAIARLVAALCADEALPLSGQSVTLRA